VQPRRLQNAGFLLQLMDKPCWIEKSDCSAYGWVFFYNAPDFIADRTKIESSLIGNVPILIERVNGSYAC
jgi:hypothetical protein